MCNSMTTILALGAPTQSACSDGNAACRRCALRAPLAALVVTALPTGLTGWCELDWTMGGCAAGCICPAAHSVSHRGSR